MLPLKSFSLMALTIVAMCSIAQANPLSGFLSLFNGKETSSPVDNALLPDGTLRAQIRNSARDILKSGTKIVTTGTETIVGVPTSAAAPNLLKAATNVSVINSLILCFGIRMLYCITNRCFL
nr:PREDICTED: uncharacterized protein LOC109033978 [Bemisia tabaci]